MNPWLLTAIIGVLVVVVVIKRRIGEPVNVRELFTAPLILTGIGVLSLVKMTGVTGTDYAWVISGAVLGGALGALRGAAVELTPRKGTLWQRYTGRTFLIMVGSLVVMAGFNVLAVKLGMQESARPVQLPLGVSFLGESLAVGWRGTLSGIPFAPAARGR
ncbi:DUF1453 family protein [Streptomyces sp. CT34]|uniref:DUF1453 family protein n=1 Tax=Streptomyces sp. CT34 TaxID=1553907 RepID=UPI00068D8E70|nr:DUF1453 family protein [Streptomyces sp. CT34]